MIMVRKNNDRKERIIFIPTYGRGMAKQITYHCMPQEIKREVVFVIRPSDAKEFKGMNTLIVDEVGVPAAREAAVQYALDLDIDRVAMFDDDLRFCARDKNPAKGAEVKLHQMSEDEVGESIDWMFDQLDTYALAAIGARGGNNNRDGDLWFNVRIMRSFAFRADILEDLDISFSKYKFWEDFHVTLQLLLYGYENVSSNFYVTDGVTNAAGGVSSYRDIDSMVETAKAFESEYSQFVKLVWKKPQSWNIDQEVPDFRIQWKKAYQYGVQQLGGKAVL